MKCGLRPRAICLLAALAAGSPLRAEGLVSAPPLAPDVEALPRLSGDTEIVQRVNDALQNRDDVDNGIATCDGENPEGAFRSVDILAEGAEFLTFIIEVGGYCEGAAHPWSERHIVNFDMRTGNETDLMEYLPRTVAEEADPADALLKLYVDGAGDDLPEDCLDALTFAKDQRQLWFDLGLDLKSQALLLLPQGLPYVASGCESEVGLSIDRLQEAGFDGKLIRALTLTP